MKKNLSDKKNGYYLSKGLLKGSNAAAFFLISFSTFGQEKDTIHHSVDIQEVKLYRLKSENFALRKLKDIEGTQIFAAKKTEAILLDLKIANKALNNPRHIFSQVAGINVFDSNDGGLQLNIGGRGLNPNRSANFNTRQNGYDISADVLGYPESYYTPPTEALEEIQIIRGAASLQFGTQFGGLLNFKLKQPNQNRNLEIVSRNTYGSFNTHTSFNSFSGTSGKLSYYGFFNYKQGDGFQSNSEYNARNFYVFSRYELTPETDISVEYTRFNYLSHQPGGLTDFLFNESPYQSLRKRNWFKVDWNLWAAKFRHQFNSTTRISVDVFGLNASRYSLGFRPLRVGQPDDETGERDLINGTFKNWGLETKFMHQYGKRQHSFLLGAKYYNAKNHSEQGPGKNGKDPDFEFDRHNKTYFFQSDYRYPNRNLAFFTENIFKISDSWTIVPGIRWENISTGARGSYQKIILDNAGNVISNIRNDEEEQRPRSFVILGIGTSYKPLHGMELYANISQNYRSVTFSDIRVENNAQVIDPNIKDETGYTADFGLRGNWKDKVSYDFTIFNLYYNNRIDNVFRKREGLFTDVAKVRTNVGRALITGIESLVDFNLNKIYLGNLPDCVFNIFVNTSLTTSQYLKSEIPGIKGNTVEFVPRLNLKTGLVMGYKNIMASLLWSHMSEQFTTATNEPTDPTDNTWGIRGTIPAYKVMDFSFSYRFNPHLKLEAGISNVLNEVYFTRRATGYPGPGIIPSAPREFYMTLETRF